MKRPDENFTVSDVADVVGLETPVEVIGVVADTRLGMQMLMNVYYRCRIPVKLPRLDPWKMGRVL
jgi:hypothetical protein